MEPKKSFNTPYNASSKPRLAEKNVSNFLEAPKSLTLGFNERKLLILEIIAERMLSTPGATPRKLLTILKERGNPITDGALRRLLNRYEKWGYVKSSPIIERDPTSGKPRKGPRTHLYSLMEKGQKWLVEAKALQDHGYPPRPGRYKVGA